MSGERASERLRAILNDCIDGGRWDNDIHGEPLLLALPEIIAVVEAAERQLITPPEVWAALDALASKLSEEGQG